MIRVVCRFAVARARKCEKISYVESKLVFSLEAVLFVVVNVAQRQVYEDLEKYMPYYYRA